MNLAAAIVCGFILLHDPTGHALSVNAPDIGVVREANISDGTAAHSVLLVHDTWIAVGERRETVLDIIATCTNGHNRISELHHKAGWPA